MKNLITKNLYSYTVYIMVLVLFFSKALPNIALIIVSILFLLKIDFKAFKFNFSSKIILLILMIYLIIKSLLYRNIIFDFKIYKGLILAFWISVLLHKIEEKRLKLVVLMSINACIVCSLFLIVFFYYQNHNLPFSNTAEVNNLLLLERPYIGFIAVLGFLLSLEKAIKIPKWRKIYSVNAIILFGFIILISARISIITIFSITGIYFIFYFKTKWYKKILYTGVLTGLFVVILVSNKNIAERFFIKDNVEKSLQEASDYEPRIVIWSCASEITKTKEFNFLTGLEGYEILRDRFLSCYASSIKNQSKKEYFLSEKFNSHNQFIDFYLVGGLIGLLLFIAFFLKLFYEVKDDFFATAIVLSFLFFFFVENIFYRQFGCYLFGIFILRLISTKQINNEQN